MKKINNYFIYNFQKIFFLYSYIFSKSFNESKLLRNNLSEDSVIFDIGSNLGSYIYLISKKNKNKKIMFHSFDPLSSNIEFQKTIKFPKKHIIKFNNIAITKYIGETHLYENSISSQSTIKKRDFNLGKFVQSYKVKTLTIDEYCKLNHIDFINLLKIDTEGSDLDVLYSAKLLIENSSIDLIKIEIENNGKSFEEIIKYLNNYGYILISTLNHTYKNNELILFDCYFKKLKYIENKIPKNDKNN